MTFVAPINPQTEIIPWSSNFATGIDIVDEQHQKLVDLLNQLAGQLVFGATEAALLAVFDELTRYAQYHFETEERIWNQYLGSDALVRSHTNKHQEFINEVERERERAAELGSDEAAEKLVSFLTHWLAFHILEDDTLLARVVLGVQRGQSLSMAKETALKQVDGTAHLMIAAVLKMYDNLSSRAMTLMREIRQRRRAEEKLRLASNIIESSADAIFITNDHGIITDVNPAFCQDVQRTRESLLGESIAQVKPNLLTTPAGQELWESARQSGRWTGDVVCRMPGGELETVWLKLSTVTSDDQDSLHFVGMVSSLSHLMARHHALEAAANQDPLTGLPNRRLLGDRLKQAMERSKRSNTLLAVCFLDLDGFKPINDSLGHDAGDLVLREMALRMEQALRACDTVARVGGDEFVLLLGDLSQPQEAVQMLERLLQDLPQPIAVAGQLVQVGASIGVTLYPDDAASAEQLQKHADLALYQAKAVGKGSYRFFAPL